MEFIQEFQTKKNDIDPCEPVENIIANASDTSETSSSLSPKQQFRKHRGAKPTGRKKVKIEFLNTRQKVCDNIIMTNFCNLTF